MNETRFFFQNETRFFFILFGFHGDLDRFKNENLSKIWDKNGLIFEQAAAPLPKVK